MDLKTCYADLIPPSGYRCTACSAHGCKLWRQYQTCADYVQLLCAECSLKDQKESGPVDEQGFRHSEYGKSDSIGWLVPAIPTEEGDTYWGYTSVPQAGVDWWRRLPSCPTAARNVASKDLPHE